MQRSVTGVALFVDVTTPVEKRVDIAGLCVHCRLMQRRLSCAINDVNICALT